MLCLENKLGCRTAKAVGHECRTAFEENHLVFVFDLECVTALSHDTTPRITPCYGWRRTPTVNVRPVKYDSRVTVPCTV